MLKMFVASLHRLLIVYADDGVFRKAGDRAGAARPLAFAFRNFENKHKLKLRTSLSLIDIDRDKFLKIMAPRFCSGFALTIWRSCTCTLGYPLKIARVAPKLWRKPLGGPRTKSSGVHEVFAAEGIIQPGALRCESQR